VEAAIRVEQTRRAWLTWTWSNSARRIVHLRRLRDCLSIS